MFSPSEFVKYVLVNNDSGSDSDFSGSKKSSEKFTNNEDGAMLKDDLENTDEDFLPISTQNVTSELEQGEITKSSLE